MTAAVAEMPARTIVQPDLTDRIAAAIDGATHDPASGLTYRELARFAYGVEVPTAAQLSAVRRSVARLVSRGRAERGKRRCPGSRGAGAVQVRGPMTAAERETRDGIARGVVERREQRARATPYPVDTGSGVESVQVEPVLVIREGGVELRGTEEVAAV